MDNSNVGSNSNKNNNISNSHHPSSSSSSSSPQSARWLASLLSHAGLSTSPDHDSANPQDSWDAHWLPNYASKWREDLTVKALPPHHHHQEQEEESDDDGEIDLDAELDVLQDSDNEYESEEEDGKRVGRDEGAKDSGEIRFREERPPIKSYSTSRSVTFDLPPISTSEQLPQGRVRSATTNDENLVLFRPQNGTITFGAPRRKPRSSSSLLTHRRSISEGDKETLMAMRERYQNGQGRLRSNTTITSSSSTLKPAQPLSIDTFLPVRMVPSSTVPSIQLEQDKEKNPLSFQSTTSSPIRPRVLDPVESQTESSVSSTTILNPLPLSLKLEIRSSMLGDSQHSMTRSSSLSDGSCHGDAGDQDLEGQLERALSDIGEERKVNQPMFKSLSEGQLQVSTSNLPLSGGFSPYSPSYSSGPSTPIPSSSRSSPNHFSHTSTSTPTKSSNFTRSRPQVHRSNSQRSRSRLAAASQSGLHQHSDPITSSQIRSHAGPFISSVADTLFPSVEGENGRAGSKRRSGQVELESDELEARSQDELYARQRANTAPATAYTPQGRSRSRGRVHSTTASSGLTTPRDLSMANRGPTSLNSFSHRFVTRMSSSNNNSRSSSPSRRTVTGRSSSPSPSQDSFASIETIRTSESGESSTCPSLSSSMSSSPSSVTSRTTSRILNESTSGGYMSGLTRGISLSQTLSRAYNSLPIPSIFSNETDNQLAKLERDCPLASSPIGLPSKKRYSNESMEESLRSLGEIGDSSGSVTRGRSPISIQTSKAMMDRHCGIVSPLWRESSQDEDDEDEWEEMNEDHRLRI